MTEIDLLVTNALIVTMDDELRLLDPGALAVKAGKIVDLGSQEELEARYYPHTTLNARGKMMLPGLINAHTHVAMAYFRGLADDLSLDDWLQKHIWPAEGRLVNPDFVYEASLHGVAEMAKNGITLLHDMYFHAASAARACREIGIRGHLGEAVLDFPMAGYSGPDEMIDYVVNCHRNHCDPLVQFCFAPHSIYACSPETLQKVKTAAEHNAMHIHIHLSETRKEVDDCLAQYGVRPVFHLDRIGLLDTHINLAHGVHLDAAECELLAQKDCGVSVCTESNLKLASGFAPLKLYRETGVRFALGTDGAASNNNLDLFGEMDITAKLHKALNQDPTFLPAVEMVKAVTCDAAKVVGMGERVGSLEPGKFADFILLDTQSLDAQPLYNVYSHIVYTLGTHHVTDVFVNGSQVVSNRRLVNADESELLQRAAQYRQRIAAEF